MALLRRYARTPILGFGYQYGTSDTIPIIRDNIANGNIRYEEITLKGFDRLDCIAARYYGDSSLSWLLATCSGIGFFLQVPPGTRIIIPVLEDVSKYV